MSAARQQNQAADAARESPRRGLRSALSPHLVAPWAAALLSLTAVIVTWRVFAGTRRGQLVEAAGLQGAAIGQRRVGTLAELTLDSVVVVFVLGILAVVAAASWRRRWWLAGSAVLLIGLSNLTAQLAKEFLVRPDLGLSALRMNSFPSGHVAAIASVSAAALLVSSPRWRPALALLGTLAVGAVGLATMIGQDDVPWHRASDVVGSVGIVALWYFVIEGVLAAVATWRSGAAAPAPRGAPAQRVRARRPLQLLGGVGGLCLALGVGALAATALRVPVSSAQGEMIAYLGSSVGVFAMICFAHALMLALRQRHPAENPPAVQDQHGEAPAAPAH